MSESVTPEALFQEAAELAREIIHDPQVEVRHRVAVMNKILGWYGKVGDHADAEKMRGELKELFTVIQGEAEGR